MKVELIGGPKDGLFESKEVCECGEPMDLFYGLEGEPEELAHHYSFRDDDDTYRYQGVVDMNEVTG